jgi:hypothetical protein
LSADYWFMDAEGRTRVLRGVRDDQARGECSGIPQCCIAYFTQVIKKSRIPIPDTVGWGYRPCPRCVRANNRVEVLDCTEERCTCGGWANSVVVD